MGLSGYLYRTTKRYFDAFEDFDRKARDFLKWGDKCMETEPVKNLFESLPTTESGRYDYRKMTEAQLHGVEWFKSYVSNKAKEIGITLDSSFKPIFDPVKYGLSEKNGFGIRELAYFDRDWKLHKFIVENYSNDKEKDNLVRIQLTKGNLSEIAKAGFYTDDFEYAASVADSRHVVYYYPWY